MSLFLEKWRCICGCQRSRRKDYSNPNWIQVYIQRRGDYWNLNLDFANCSDKRCCRWKEVEVFERCIELWGSRIGCQTMEIVWLHILWTKFVSANHGGNLMIKLLWIWGLIVKVNKASSVCSGGYGCYWLYKKRTFLNDKNWIHWLETQNSGVLEDQ